MNRKLILCIAGSGLILLGLGNITAHEYTITSFNTCFPNNTKVTEIKVLQQIWIWQTCNNCANKFRCWLFQLSQIWRICNTCPNYFRWWFYQQAQIWISQSCQYIPINSSSCFLSSVFNVNVTKVQNHLDKFRSRLKFTSGAKCLQL